MIESPLLLAVLVGVALFAMYLVPWLRQQVGLVHTFSLKIWRESIALYRQAIREVFTRPRMFFPLLTVFLLLIVSRLPIWLKYREFQLSGVGIADPFALLQFGQSPYVYPGYEIPLVPWVYSPFFLPVPQLSVLATYNPIYRYFFVVFGVILLLGQVFGFAYLCAVFQKFSAGESFWSRLRSMKFRHFFLLVPVNIIFFAIVVMLYYYDSLVFNPFALDLLTLIGEVIWDEIVQWLVSVGLILSYIFLVSSLVLTSPQTSIAKLQKSWQKVGRQQVGWFVRVTVLFVVGRYLVMSFFPQVLSFFIPGWSYPGLIVAFVANLLDYGLIFAYPIVMLRLVDSATASQK